MKRGPHQASPLMVNNRMAGTRITVWDVLHDLETGGPRSEMAVTVHLSDAHVDAVARDIADSQAALMAVHQQIAARKARGNPPASTATWAPRRTKWQQWRKPPHEPKTAGVAACEREPGRCPRCRPSCAALAVVARRPATRRVGGPAPDTRLVGGRGTATGCPRSRRVGGRSG
jgi:hypothetical protein